MLSAFECLFRALHKINVFWSISCPGVRPLDALIVTVTPRAGLPSSVPLSLQSADRLVPVLNTRLVLGLQEWFRRLRVGNIAVAMRISLLDCTGEFAAPVRYKKQKRKRFVQLGNISSRRFNYGKSWNSSIDLFIGIVLLGQQLWFLIAPCQLLP